jgi:stearoyl-CoA desaturase (delta-9 desaturase)
LRIIKIDGYFNPTIALYHKVVNNMKRIDMIVKSNANRSINWTNSLYLILAPFIAAGGLYYWISSGSFNWSTIILAVILLTFCQVSITAGYHRLFSHRTYSASWPVRLFFLVFGAAAFEGSAIHWSLDHRVHHNYCDDNEKDPYSIGKGFFWAHMGWLLFKQDEQVYEQEKNTRARDLYEDPLLVWQMKYWVLVGAFVTFILPALIALSWGDLLGGLFIAGILRSVINHHATFLINSLSHVMGAQTYSDSHSARDNLFTAFLTFGEGYHNYHHEFPSDYRNGVRPWDWDPSKWIIKALSCFGLTWNLKKIPDEIIIRKKMQMKEKRMQRKLAAHQDFLASNHGKALMQLKDRMESAFKEVSAYRQEMQKLINSKSKFSHGQGFIKLEIKELNNRMNKAREDFMQAVREWNFQRRRVLAYVKA